MLRLPPTRCAEVDSARAIAQTLDMPLAESVEQHLEGCPRCAQFGRPRSSVPVDLRLLGGANAWNEDQRQAAQRVVDSASPQERLALVELLRRRIGETVPTWSVIDTWVRLGHSLAEDADAEVRRAVVRLLGAAVRVDVPGEVAAVKDVRASALASLYELLNDASGYVGIEAARALGEVIPRHPSAQIRLLNVLDDPESVDGVRAAVVEALELGTWDSDRVVAALLVRVEKDVNWNVRRLAVRSVAGRAVPSETIDRALAQRIRDDADWEVRRAACRALGTVGRRTADVHAAIRMCLNDPEAGVRTAAAAELVGFHVSPGSAAKGIVALLTAADPATRLGAVQALPSIALDLPAVATAVRRVLSDASPAIIRLAAMTAVTHSGWVRFDSSGQALRTLIRDPDPRVRAAAQRAGEQPQPTGGLIWNDGMVGWRGHWTDVAGQLVDVDRSGWGRVPIDADWVAQEREAFAVDAEGWGEVHLGQTRSLETVLRVEQLLDHGIVSLSAPRLASPLPPAVFQLRFEQPASIAAGAVVERLPIQDLPPGWRGELVVREDIGITLELSRRGRLLPYVDFVLVSHSAPPEGIPFLPAGAFLQPDTSVVLHGWSGAFESSLRSGRLRLTAEDAELSTEQADMVRRWLPSAQFAVATDAATN